MELIQTSVLKSCKDFGNQRCKTLLAYEPGTDLDEQISPKENLGRFSSRSKTKLAIWERDRG